MNYLELLEMVMFLFGILFVISLQPVFMISSMIFITFIYSLYIYMELGSYWFSYLLLMVMLSGVLVVFTYMITLIPNESFEITGLLFIMMFMFMYVMKYKEMFYNDMSLESVNLWNTYLGMFNIFLVSLLLLVMLMVVFLSNMHYGSFRIN